MNPLYLGFDRSFDRKPANSKHRVSRLCANKDEHKLPCRMITTQTPISSLVHSGVASPTLVLPLHVVLPQLHPKFFQLRLELLEARPLVRVAHPACVHHLAEQFQEGSQGRFCSMLVPASSSSQP